MIDEKHLDGIRLSSGLLQAMDEALRSGAESMRAATGAAVAEWRPGGWPLDLYVIRGGAFLPAAESR